MKRFLAFVLPLCSLAAHAQPSSKNPSEKEFSAFVERFDEAWLRLNPVEATERGDERYNDRLYIDFTDSYRAECRGLVGRYRDSLRRFNRRALKGNMALEYDVLEQQLDVEYERLTLADNLMPFNQKLGLPVRLPLMGSGNQLQPFKTVADYDNWLKRAAIFPAWCDSAIAYFRRGMQAGIVLPRALVERTLPQLQAVISEDPARSLFWAPIRSLPGSFSSADSARLAAAYRALVLKNINPSYRKLHQFLEREYLPQTRSSSGYGALPGGKSMYDFYIRFYTTTSLPADSIFALGLGEVARIRGEMEAVKIQMGFKGDLNGLFNEVRSNPKYYPYTTEEAILGYYRGLKAQIDPVLSRMFNRVPRTPFEVRAVEAFRAATTAANYVPGTLATGRPGIFYVPIVEPAKTQVRASLFLHEAIPGHHYQISLQMENLSLSKFRRYSGNSAFGEGWGLYAESLGDELGLYNDPLQRLLALSDEIHRAIRLVVDVGMHAKGWTREQAVRYSLDNEPIEEQRAVSEVERYMARPGQALAYKVGELKIKMLRSRYQKQLGSKFNLAAFHDAVLTDGNLPLDVLERKLDVWAAAQR